MALDTTVSGADADSYVTLADFQAYAASMGFSVSGEVSAQEAALRRSALFLDTSWSWTGKAAEDTQARAFPRGSDTTIHKPIRDAQCELAIRVLAGGDLFALAADRAVKSESVKVDGAVEEAFEYEGGLSGGGAARAFPVVDALVRRYAVGVASPSGSAGAASIGITK